MKGSARRRHAGVVTVGEDGQALDAADQGEFRYRARRGRAPDWRPSRQQDRDGIFDTFSEAASQESRPRRA